MSDYIHRTYYTILSKKALTSALSSLLMTATVLEGLFREYHSSSAALGQQHPEVTAPGCWASAADEEWYSLKRSSSTVAVKSSELNTKVSPFFDSIFYSS